jgi:hypothetical protein
MGVSDFGEGSGCEFPKRPGLTAVYCPVTLVIIAELQKTVAGIMPLSATGAGQKPSPGPALPVVVRRHAK